jgi:hypothetical protein
MYDIQSMTFKGSTWSVTSSLQTNVHGQSIVQYQWSTIW